MNKFIETNKICIGIDLKLYKSISKELKVCESLSVDVTNRFGVSAYWIIQDPVQTQLSKILIRNRRRLQ